MSVAREAAVSEKSATRGGCVNRYEWWRMRGAATGRRVADAGRDREGRTANEIGVAEEISASNATKGDLLQFSHVSKVAKNGRPCDLGKWRRKIRAISRDAKKLQQIALRCGRTLRRWAKAPRLSLAAPFVAGEDFHIESGKGVPPAPVTPCRPRFSAGYASLAAHCKCPGASLCISEYARGCWEASR